MIMKKLTIIKIEWILSTALNFHKSLDLHEFIMNRPNFFFNSDIIIFSWFRPSTPDPFSERRPASEIYATYIYTNVLFWFKDVRGNNFLLPTGLLYIPLESPWKNAIQRCTLFCYILTQGVLTTRSHIIKKFSPRFCHCFGVCKILAPYNFYFCPCSCFLLMAGFGPSQSSSWLLSSDERCIEVLMTHPSGKLQNIGFKRLTRTPSSTYLGSTSQLKEGTQKYSPW